MTVTLPERTIDLLSRIDNDRAVAIVKSTDATAGVRDYRRSPVQLVEVEAGRAVIIVGPSRSLVNISWLRLVEIAPARFLLVLPTGTPIETLELAILDLLETIPKNDEYERDLLTTLRASLSKNRHGKRVSKAELLLIDIS